MQQSVRLKQGLLESLAAQMRLDTDEQLAAVIDVPLEELDNLKAGGPVSWAVAMRISAIRGSSFDARGIVERIPGHMSTRMQASA